MVSIHLSGKAEQDDSCIFFSGADPQFRKLLLHFIFKLDMSLQGREYGKSRTLHPDIHESQIS